MSEEVPSSLLDLVHFLRQSRQTVGLIKIPSTIEDAVKRDLSPQSATMTSHVEAIVAALDHQEPSLCSRLDLHAFIIVYLILSRSEDCAAQQRGLALLTESLQGFSSSSPEVNTLGLEKKVRLGQKAVNFLIQHFGNQKRLCWTRRWMGIFALELLSGCNENKNLLLTKAQDAWRSIRDNMLHGKCEILKLVAGLLVNELWPHGPPTDAPWFSERDSAIYASFPTYINRSSQWVIDYESFVDVLDSEGLLSEKRTGVFLAYGVSVGSDMNYGWEDHRPILVTISTELNIVVCASETSPARYIDVLRDQIESVRLEKRQRMSQSSPLVTQNFDIIVIRLKNSSDTTFYLGAGKRFASLINIAFTSIDEATAMIKHLLESAPQIIEKFTCSESEPLNLSQPLVEKTEEQEMLYDAAPQVSAFRSAVVTSATESVSLPVFSQESERDLTHSFLHWPKNIPAGLQRTAGHLDLRSDSGISIEDNQIEGLGSCPRSHIQTPEDMSDGPLRSSAEWRRGAMLIDSAPELQDTHNHVVEKGEPLMKSTSPARTTSVERDGDYNSFYNATPRGQDANVKQAEQLGIHNDRQQDLQLPVEYIPIHNAEPRDVNENPKLEPSRLAASGVGGSQIPALKRNEQVNGDIPATEKPRVINNQKYGSKKNLLASSTLKKEALRKTQADRKTESLSVKVSRFQQEKQEGDEFDFPLSPQKTRTPRNIEFSISKKAQHKEGTMGPTTEKKPLAYRSIPPDTGTSLAGNIDAHINDSRELLDKLPFKLTKIKDAKDELANIDRDESLANDEKTNGAELNSKRKRPARGKAKFASKRARNNDNEAYSTKKDLGKTKRKSTEKPKSASRLAPQPRSRRAAALIADQKIKKSVNCDASQEQSGSRINHHDEISRTNSSQAALPPQKWPCNNPNFDCGGSEQSELALTPKPFENDIMSHEEKPEIAIIPKVKLQVGNSGGIANINATDLGEDQTLHSAVVREDFNHPRVPVNDNNGTTTLDEKEQAKAAQVSGLAVPTSSPESGTHVKVKNNNQKQPDNGCFHCENLTLNDGLGSYTKFQIESPEFKSPAPSRPRMPDEASSEGVVFADDISGSSRNHQVESTLRPPTNGSGSREFFRFVKIGAKRRALVPHKTNQKAEESLGLKAHTAVMTTTALKKGNSFAINLRKALSGVDILDEHCYALAARTQTGVQDNAFLETYLAKPSTALSRSQIPVAEGNQTGYRNQMLETAEVGPPVSPVNSLRKLSKKSERLYITISPSESPSVLPEMENSNIMPFSTKVEGASSSEYSEYEIQVDQSLSGKREQDFQPRQTPEKSKQAAPQPVHLPHRIKGANPQERLFTQAIGSRTTPTKDINRKANLISFNVRGPQNQGVIFNQNGQSSSSSQRHPFCSLVVNSDRSLKRKLPTWEGDALNLDTDLIAGKRPRILTSIPKAQNAVQHRSSFIKEANHRPSSQSTRVNENGSPMPFMHSRQVAFQDHGFHASAEIKKFSSSVSDDEEGDLLSSGDKINVEPSISALEPRLPKATKMSWRNSSSNSKRKRTLNESQSPGANQLTAHRIHPSGEFINVHTENVVLPIRPPDPFIETRKSPRNTFMEMLRRSGNPSDKSVESNCLGLRGQDPDKTLIEDQSKTPSTEGSSLESSTSKLGSSSESPSSSEREVQGEDPWRKNLEPHQIGQLEALHDISHRLVARLIEKENTIHDLVSDYKRGGTRLIHEFEKARKQDIEVFRTGTDEMKRKLASVVKEESAKLKYSMDQMERTQVADLEKKWEAQQRTMWAKMNAALAASAN